MFKPMSVTIVGGLALGAATIFLVLAEETRRNLVIADEYDLNRRLHAHLTQTGDSMRLREAIITSLLHERITLADARAEFRRLNDQRPGCWNSLHAEFPESSDEQCLDRQLQIYLERRRTPDVHVACERLLNQLQMPSSETPRP